METVEAELVDARTGELVPMPEQSSAIVSADPAAVVEAFERYKAIQSALDRAMPDCIQEIRGRHFRKKMYWRAIATAFNLSLELMSEARTEDGEDWGWLVTYRATAPNGRHADGDGSCFASEKASGQDSVHNVRAHAHTRAKNRAVSDLVGFGEVSAEEMPLREPQPSAPRAAEKQTPPVALPASAPAWFAQKVGFGKHREMTWADMSAGEIGKGRHEYLLWLRGNIEEKIKGHKANERDHELLERVKLCLTWISNREDRIVSAEDDNGF